ncbi:hypothetical protein YWIDRAFT_05166 [Streptomyces sp. SceaMP-e96]|nr:hypothetical protein YWIDRAFT_05166 [Streptomyces sp. SceaMP-e96]
MLERVKDAPAGVDAVKAIGSVSKSDYQTVDELSDALSGARLRKSGA